MTRIVWTKDEKRALQDCMTDICYVTPTMSNKGLFKHAQEEVIPYERRHKITDQKVFAYKAMINNARFVAEEHRKKAAAKPAPAPAPEPTPEPVRKLDTLGQVFELFIDALADRIMDKMIKAKQQHEEANEPSITLEELDKTFDRLYPEWKNAPLQKTEDVAAARFEQLFGNPMEQLNKLTIRKKKPTVLVIGLNGHQMECVKQGRPEVDFTFITAEQAVSQYTFNKDHTFLMTRFINHSVQNKYRKHPNLHFVNGGVTELKTLLHGIFNKEHV